jgi:hypothetical protein
VPERSVETEQSSSPSRPARLEEGMKVEVNYKGKGKWFKGKISRVRLNRTFDIEYDDGDRESGVEKENVRPRDEEQSSSPSRPAGLEEGMKVEVNYKGKGKWYPGKIKREHSDGTFDIEYDDGDRETYVEKQNVRPRDGAESSNGGKPRKGDKVEASCKGSTRKYPGTIHADNYDGTFDIKFDDGDRDRAVPERSVETEVNYKGKEKWFKGKIKREQNAVTPELVLNLTAPTQSFLCPLSANSYGIEFISFRLTDNVTKRVFFAVGDGAPPPPPQIDFDLSSMLDENTYRKVKYEFSQDFFAARSIAAHCTFSCGDREIQDLRLIEKHYFRNQLIRSYDFIYG